MLIGGTGKDAERVARQIAAQPARARTGAGPRRVAEQVAS